MIKLTLTEKGGEPKVLTFDKDEITIGRVSGNDIVLAKGNISKRHTRLTKRDDGMEIADLKSTNGTYVNGRKIAGPTAVAPSDRIYVGDFLIGLDGPGAAWPSRADCTAPRADCMARRPRPARPAGCRSHRRPRRRRAADRAPRGCPTRTRPRRAARTRKRPGWRPGRRARDARSRPRRRRRPRRRAGSPRRSPAGRWVWTTTMAYGRRARRRATRSRDDTGNVGLFQHTRRGDDDGDAGSRRIPTGNRPGLAGGGAVRRRRRSAARRDRRIVTSLDATGGAASGLEALLADPAVTQILITAPDAALVDRGSGLTLYDGSLGDSNAVADVLWRYSNNAYPPPPPDNPVVDVRLPDGTRVSAAFPPAATAGVVASIRRTVLPDRVLADLVPGANKDVQALLDALVATRRNVLITGDVAALPSVLAAFAREVPADRRVVAIGATARARSGWIDLAPTGDAAGLLRVAASLRPDHLVVGELTGPEAAELVLVATRGQNGILLAMPGRTASRGGHPVRRAGGGRAGRRRRPPRPWSRARSISTCTSWRRMAARASSRSASRARQAPSWRWTSGCSLYSEGSKRDAAGGRLQGRGVSARLGAAMAAAGSTVPSSLVGK